MSSILDALEKAHRKRRSSGTGLAPEELAEAERHERRVRDETIRHRRTFLLMIVGIGALALLLLIAITALVYVAMGSRYSIVPTAEPQVAASPPGAPAPGTTVALPQATPTSTPIASVEAVVAEVEEPAVEEAAMPETNEVVEAVRTAESIASPTPAEPVATATPTTPRFAHMQVVYDAELGMNIRGILADGPSSVIMIDDTTVALGRRYKSIRPIRIENRMIEAEYEQDGQEITIFIRW